MDFDRWVHPLNPLIVRLLHSPLHGLASRGLMTISYRGRRSGRRITLPVGYQHHGERIDVLVSKAPGKTWWRNFREPAAVELRVRGHLVRGTAVLVADDDPAFVEAFADTFERLPFLTKQFGVEGWAPGTPPSDDQLERLRSEGRLIRVRITADGSA